MTDGDAGARGYARDAGLAAAARIAPLAVQLLVTPVVVAEAGVASYAIWALMATTINLLLTADLGVVGIMQRYHGIARGRRDPRLGGRVTGTVLVVLLMLTIVMAVLGPVIADAALSIVQVDPAVVSGARLVFSQVGVLAMLQLIGLAFGAYLAAHGRFGRMAIASIVARLAGAVVLLVSLALGSGLEGLVVAAYADAAFVVVGGMLFCWRHLLWEVRGLARRDEVRELWGFAWRNQASAVGFVAQRESDVVIAAILLAAAAQGTIASTAQLAAAAALAPTVLLVPLFTRFSIAAGSDPASAVRLFPRAETVWLTGVVPFSVIVVVSLPLFASGWLGPELALTYETSLLFAAGYLVALLNSVRGTLVRSIGRPGLETASYVATVGVKLAVGIPVALLVGVLGLAASTLIASIAGVVVLWVLTSRIDGLRRGRIPRWSALSSAGALVVGGATSFSVHLAGLDRPVVVSASIVLALVLSGLFLLVARRAGARGTQA